MFRSYEKRFRVSKKKKERIQEPLRPQLLPTDTRTNYRIESYWLEVFAPTILDINLDLGQTFQTNRLDGRSDGNSKL